MFMKIKKLTRVETSILLILIGVACLFISPINFICNSKEYFFPKSISLIPVVIGAFLLINPTFNFFYKKILNSRKRKMVLSEKKNFMKKELLIADEKTLETLFYLLDTGKKTTYSNERIFHRNMLPHYSHSLVQFISKGLIHLSFDGYSESRLAHIDSDFYEILTYFKSQSFKA